MPDEWDEAAWDDTPDAEQLDDLPPEKPVGKPTRFRRRRTDGPDRRAYLVARDKFRSACIAANAYCYFGDGPINYALAHPDPGSFTVHHTVPVAVRPDLELETSLWAPSHALCNKLGTAAYDTDGRPPAPEDVLDTGIPSEDWS
ncbi:MAG TPA: hypothetical protein VMU34_21135 [Mycobacterium sp.]|nr:hypothetical protein [Mycobacterium sp.]